MAKQIWGVLLATILVGMNLITSSCVFGPNRFYGVMSHRGNRIFIRHDRWYYVGKLPEGWNDLETRARAAAWYNPDYLSTISTDVLCESSVGDRPLDSVASTVVSALENRVVTSTQEFMLDGRGARREIAKGTVDGVPLIMDTVVVKKNNCAFNMMAVAPPDEMPNVKPDFEIFFNGFRYGDDTVSEGAMHGDTSEEQSQNPNVSF